MGSVDCLETLDPCCPVDPTSFMSDLSFQRNIPGESKKVYSFGGL